MGIWFEWPHFRGKIIKDYTLQVAISECGRWPYYKKMYGRFVETKIVTMITRLS